MTPMPANSDHKSDDRSLSTRSPESRLRIRGLSAILPSAEHSVFSAPSASIAEVPAAARLVGESTRGTIGAAIAQPDLESYTGGSEVLLNGVPLVQARALEAAPRVRATDLITERREISGQVNRMMSQVDRAIHRLGEHAGPLLRR